MIRFILLAALLAYPAFAGTQSVLLTSGATAATTLPNSSPYTASDTQGTWYITFRVHNFTAGTGSYGNRTIFTVPGDYFWCSINTTSQLECGNFYDASAGIAPLTIAWTDFVVTYKRSPTAWGVRACSTIALTSCVTTGDVAITAQGTGRVQALTLGAPGTASRLAFWRWYTGTPAAEPRENDAAGGRLNYELEGSLSDTSGHSQNLSGSVSYASSPVYPPSCNAGAQQTFRAGFSGTLDGTGSVSLDGSATLTYFWQFLSGPSQVAFLSRTASMPLVDRFIFGSYTFQLEVTDGSGQKSTCTVKHGAVATDSKGVVIQDNATRSKVLGPLLRYGLSPWLYLDQTNKAWADMLGAKQGVTFTDAWNVAAGGTLSVTNGLATVTGVGTNFQTDFCGGGASGTGEMLVVWYPYSAYDGSAFATGATPYTTGIGRKAATVASCASATSMTLSSAWNYGTTQSSLSYARWTVAEQAIWINGSSNANYYDSVMAFYSLYYRTGIDDYLTFARWLADKWWTMPFIDRGMASDLNHGYLFPRIESLTGLYLRAMDGQSAMYQGLRTVVAKHRYDLRVTSTTPPGIHISDVREEHYEVAFVALCGLLDPTSFAADCRTDLAQSMNNRWEPRQNADGSWYFLSQGTSPWGNGSLGTANVTNGSTTVIGVGTVWDATTVTNNPYFWTTCSDLDSLVCDDATFYTVTRVSNTQLTLNKPYEGATTTGRLWELSPSWVGRGTQPFMLGIGARSWDYAYESFNAAGDTANANIAKANVSALTDWLGTDGLGYQSAQKGLWYGVGFQVCTPPSSHVSFCQSPDGLEAARELAGEIYGAYAASYLLTGNAATKTSGDIFFSAVFAAYPGDPGYDGTYSTGITPNTGFYFGTGNPKWLGFFWGFGSAPNWIAARLGAVAAADPRSSPIQFVMSGIPNAAKISVTVIAPTGTSVTVVCTSSPCVASVDRAMSAGGYYLMQYSYLTSGSVVLATSDVQKLYVQ